MNAGQFDHVSRSLVGATRRTVLGALLGGVATSLGLEMTEGKKKKKGKKGKKKNTCKNLVPGACCPGKTCGDDCFCMPTPSGGSACVIGVGFCGIDCMVDADCQPGERCVIEKGCPTPGKRMCQEACVLV